MRTSCAGTSAACTATRWRGCWWGTARTSCSRVALDGAGRSRDRGAGGRAELRALPQLRPQGRRRPPVPAAAAGPAGSPSTSWRPRSSAIRAGRSSSARRTIRPATPLPVERVERLLERLEAPLLLDNAYGEFCRYDYRPLLARYPHLILFRTFSKAWSLAGMRLGYLLADPRLVTELIKVKLPYNLGHAAVIAGRVALEAEDEARRRVRLLVARRRAVGGDAGGGGLRGLPLRGQLPARPLLAARSGRGEVREMLEARSIRVRDVSGYPGSAGACGCRSGRGRRCGRRGRRCGETLTPRPPLPFPPALPHRERGRRTDGTSRARPPARPGSVSISISTAGARRIQVPNGFFGHMLTALATHAGLGIDLEAEGDTHVDLHHTVEDVGIALGEALAAALGDRRGIVRFAHAYAPLDEALARAVVDLSGRGTFAYDGAARGGRRLGDGRLSAHPGRRLLPGVRGPRPADAPSGRPRRPQRPPRGRGGVQGRGAGAPARRWRCGSGSADVPSTKGTLSA